MVDIRFTNSERTFLKNMIGQSLLSIESTQADDCGQIYGNLVLKTSGGDYELRNELETVRFFDSYEDISSFHVRKLDENEAYAPMILDTPIVNIPIGENVTSIILIEDCVNVSNVNKECVYEISFDTAIILCVGKDEYYVFSREWYFEEEILFVKTIDYQTAVYPIDKIIEDWTDEENHTSVKCKRREIIL